MLKDRYDTQAETDFKTFDFISTGPNGNIKKVIRYAEMKERNFYNLGFGDKDPITGYVNDISVTNNNDSQKVLATVAATLYAFFDEYPEATVIATGTTEARTRLYRMGITNNLEEVEQDFVVLGLAESGWESFRKTVNYSAFLVRRKT